MNLFRVDARRHLAKLRRVSFVRNLTSRLLQRAPDRNPARDQKLERALSDVWDDVIQRYPALAAQGGAFGDHVAGLLPLDGDLSEVVRGVVWSDLALAFLALQGEASALAELVGRLRPIVIRVAARRDGPDEDELSFALEGKLFDPEDSKLAAFAGSGDLDGWLSVMATRTWLNLKRARGREQLSPRAEPAAMGVEVNDPELAYLKELYREQFRTAFEKAAHSLSSEERNVLAAHYSKRSSIDVIAAGRGVHRATAARRVNRARERLLSETRRLLIAELDLSRADLESVMQLIQSQLHVTLSRLFAEPKS